LAEQESEVLVAPPDQLIVDVVDLRRRTGSRRTVESRVVIDDLEVGERLIVDRAVQANLVVEAVTEGLVVSGQVTALSRTACRGCLGDVDVLLDFEIREIFEATPIEGETWPIDDERIDLTPVLREVVLLNLPVAPLCAEDCAGPEPGRFPTGLAPGDEPPRDERWAALDELRFEE